MRGCLTTSLLLLVVFVLGMVLPRFLIGDGVNLYEGGYRKLAEQALSDTEAFHAGDPAAAFITAKRVMKVGMCSQNPPNFDSRYPPNFDSRHYWIQGEVRLYTIFGIPRGELRFQCEGTDIISCPPAGAECEQDRNVSVGAATGEVCIGAAPYGTVAHHAGGEG